MKKARDKQYKKTQQKTIAAFQSQVQEKTN